MLGYDSDSDSDEEIVIRKKPSDHQMAQQSRRDDSPKYEVSPPNPKNESKRQVKKSPSP